MRKTTITLDLTEREMEILDALCAKKGLSRAALLRQALRLYQAVDQRLEQGKKLEFENRDKGEQAELVVL